MKQICVTVILKNMLHKYLCLFYLKIHKNYKMTIHQSHNGQYYVCIFLLYISFIQKPILLHVELMTHYVDIIHNS